MLAPLLATLALLAPACPAGDEARARWLCEPGSVEVGEPFRLVLEVEHPAAWSGAELVAGTPEPDESWAILGSAETVSEPADDGSVRTRRTWRMVSLEPGVRGLGAMLAAVKLPERLTRIEVGSAHVSVRGVLAEGEDEPRQMRQFPEGFGEFDESAGSRWLLPALGLLALAAVGGLVLWRLRKRPRSATAAPLGPLERLGELERASQGTGGREECYGLTRLLREVGDGLRARERGGLTDEEWLAEVKASFDVPRGAVEALEEVFARTTRVKYGAEQPTPWAMQETFARARTACEALVGGRRP